MGGYSETGLIFTGDAGRYIPQLWMTEESQIPMLKERLGCTEEQALLLYKNGILAPRKEYLPYYEIFERRLVALDIYNKREIWAEDICNKQLDLPKVITTAEPDSRSIRRIRAHLLDYASSREDCLDFQLPVWSPLNKEQLDSVLKTVESRVLATVSTNQYKLWFRGQPKEYPSELRRDKEINEWLGYSIKNRPISLMPSLARLAIKDSEVRTPDWAMFGPLFRWRKPIMSWIFLRNPSWFDSKPGYLNKIRNAVATEDIDTFGKILFDVHFDPLIADEADDVEQWFLTHYCRTSFPLVCQHYGMPTSNLDVTSDIETAIFFALNNLNPTSRRFELLDSSQREDSVIYLFIERIGAINSMNANHHAFVSSEDLIQYGGPAPLISPLRIERQKCGLIAGADQWGLNLPVDILIGKIRLNDYSEYPKLDGEYLFPNCNEDDLYDLLLDCKPELKELVHYGY